MTTWTCNDAAAEGDALWWTGACNPIKGRGGAAPRVLCSSRAARHPASDHQVPQSLKDAAITEVPWLSS